MRHEKRKFNWIAVTAGMQPKNFNEAAKRVEQEVLKLNTFSQILNFGVGDLPNACPQTYEKYGKYLNEHSKGFGFYSWKPEIVHSVLSGKYGECDGIVWIDGGCEIFSTHWTRRILRFQLEEAEQLGYLVYELQTPESQFTKRRVFKEFRKLDERDMSGQIQANHFFLCGQLGRLISDKWLEKSLTNINLLDDSLSSGGESRDFIEHKCDQSILSLVIKSMGAIHRMRVPRAGNRGIVSQLKAINTPVWVARNRSGRTIKKIPLRFIEKIS